ncbi:sigma-70 family RNA polymerase sigma factor [Candidatus Woesearchaeota archaeon]|nr:sigma-70 family RNA polymerase sigma factor [Candidatus Woesearchaeota archaeon]
MLQQNLSENISTDGIHDRIQEEEKYLELSPLPTYLRDVASKRDVSCSDGYNCDSYNLPSNEKERELYQRIAQSRDRLLESICRYAKKELFQELERILSNPDEKFTLAGIGEEETPHRILASLYEKLKAIDSESINYKSIDSESIYSESINSESIDSESINSKSIDSESIDSKRRLNNAELNSEKQQQGTHAERCGKMAECLRQMHLTFNYYHKIIAMYGKNQSVRYDNELICEHNETDTKNYTNNNKKIAKKTLETALLEKQLKEYEENVNKFLEPYFGMVIPIARRYYQKMRHVSGDLDILDLIQEGNIGLMRAAEKFDCNKYVRFSAYARHSIKSEINRAIDDQIRLIRTPWKFNAKIRHYEEIRQELAKKESREPTRDEVYKQMGLSDNEIKDLERGQQVLFPKSLHQQIESEKGLSLLDKLPDNTKSIPNAEDRIIEDELNKKAHEVFMSLSSRDEDIVARRIGLEGCMKTGEEIAARWGISRIRVYQLEGKIMKRLAKKFESCRDLLD